MKVPFYKYHGTGNDFILMDDRNGQIPMDLMDIPRLTDRHFGIGSDGLILIRKHPELDFEMVFYNPDGSQSFCGNGSRCAMQFAIDLGISGPSARFLSTDGVHSATKLEDGWIKLNMTDTGIPRVMEEDLEINTGSPHYIRFRDLEGLDIITEARAIRYNEMYSSSGINVNFVEITPDGIQMRTYERGVEDETLSCGTGVTAAALATHFRNNAKQGVHAIRVHTRGGDLRVEFNFDGSLFTDVYLCGPAESVFKGEVEL